MLVSSQDAVRLGSKLTVKKLTNMYNIWSSYKTSLKRKEVLLKGMPWSISVEPTTACNLRCPECPSGLRSFTRPTGKIHTDVFDSIIDELHPTLFYLIFYFQGEPYLHPQFLEMVKKAESKNIYTATSTNAHFLNEKTAEATVESGLSRIIISIDGSTQDTYESYRKEGSLEKVIEGTRHIIAARKRLKKNNPAILWQFLVVRPNEHQIDEVKELGRKLGVDKVAFKTAQIYDYEFGNELIPTIDKYSRYRQLENGQYEVKFDSDSSCWKMWHSCVITWDGRVVPCCFDKDAHHVMGTLENQSFKQVWESDSYNTFRTNLLDSRSQYEICKNCSEGVKTWA